MSESPKKFHLGWFLSFNTPAWDLPTSGNVGETWTDGTFHIAMAKKLEAAGFDFLMYEDSSKVPNVYEGNSDKDLSYGLFAPKHDPVLLAAALSRETDRIGIITTMSTSFYPPYIVARSVSTLDHFTHGRSGWNMVTSSGDIGAKNFGHDELFEHDLRYEMAEEFTQVVTGLWDSWEPGALVMDRDNSRYVDHTKVRPIHFEGQFYKVRGPLTNLPSPQGRPVICQAGGSEQGRAFAARWADTIVCASQGAASMKEYRDDIRRRLVENGRDPDSCKIMFVVEPIVGRTSEEAQEKLRARYELTDFEVEASLAYLSTHTEIDFAQFDLDAPLPADLTTNGHQTSLKSLYRMGSTVREIAKNWWHHYINEDLVGSPEEVAAAMGSLMDEVGGDGFLISTGRVLDGTYVDDIADLLVPALQSAGRVRTEYAHEHLRDNLFEF